ncbi:putative ribosome quality control (RQC) complex YloA/Tae2 family protein [Geomicrobium halophilum]|uniref:Rqc2 homolog RqcH n=1 Tax=Geomicrobium halophilum TaxID=549000 RepID=A0A841PQ95_9BACL|nr:NFACT RNA binding domain-containing protein [Geomicrobium halophilum]MBB6449356.1 putative ribosome quality control (RQC) complex YloA/Tae2 family protein [Geomicrobium halophilum]
MSYDGFVLRAVLHEWKETLKGGRITKIKQPTATDIYMTIRNDGRNYTTLLSIHPSFARLHFSPKAETGPAEPPMFCRILRKNLEGGFIRDIEQDGLERVATLHIEGTDEIGDRENKRLVMELMGKHSNLLLIDNDDKIVDCMKHISAAVNRYRTLLPGQTYEAPPDQHKQNPLEADEEAVLRTLDFNQGKIDRQLFQNFTGMSPLLAKEIVHRAGIGPKQQLIDHFMNMMKLMKSCDFQPTIVREKKKEFFHIIDLTHLDGEKDRYQTSNDMVLSFYEGKADRDRIKQQAFDLERLIRNQRIKNEKKLEKLQETAKTAEKELQNQKLGELLTAHMHQIRMGDSVAEVIDYYDESAPTIQIDLDPEKSPADNAQDYFHRYNKAKNAGKAVKKQRQHAKREIEYFESLLQQLDSIEAKDITEIRDELEEGGYLKAKKTKKRKKKNNKPSLDRYVSSDGVEIYVGKNNKQNEYLTSRLARRSDTWLHTKDIPGSHVVIRADEFSEETLSEAAELAAYYSKARESGSVPVDYTLIRHVKKPNGAKPGFVTYDEQKTLFVTPKESTVKQLRQ